MLLTVHLMLLTWSDLRKPQGSPHSTFTETVVSFCSLFHQNQNVLSMWEGSHLETGKNNLLKQNSSNNLGGLVRRERERQLESCCLQLYKL